MGRGPQTLPLKGQRVNIFGFVSHKSLLVLLNYTTLPLEPKRKNKKQKQPEAIRKQWERAWFSANKTLFTKPVDGLDWALELQFAGPSSRGWQSSLDEGGGRGHRGRSKMNNEKYPHFPFLDENYYSSHVSVWTFLTCSVDRAYKYIWQVPKGPLRFICVQKRQKHTVQWKQTTKTTMGIFRNPLPKVKIPLLSFGKYIKNEGDRKDPVLEPHA